MVSNCEIIGNYNVRKLPNGMYRVSVNNGNIGAGLWDEVAVNKLREKYSVNNDYFSFNKNNTNTHSKMSYDEARKILLYGTGEFGLLHNLKLQNQALDTVFDYEAKSFRDKFRDKLPGGLWTGFLSTIA